MNATTKALTVRNLRRSTAVIAAAGMNSYDVLDDRLLSELDKALEEAANVLRHTEHLGGAPDPDCERCLEGHRNSAPFAAGIVYEVQVDQFGNAEVWKDWGTEKEARVWAFRVGGPAAGVSPDFGPYLTHAMTSRLAELGLRPTLDSQADPVDVGGWGFQVEYLR